MSSATPYEQIPAINWSSLKNLAVSPKLYRYRLDHPKEDTQAIVIGRAIHCAVLEPGKFDSRYAVFDGTRRGKAWDEWQAGHPGIQSLKPDELAHVQACAAAVRADKVAWGILGKCRTEEPITWTDSESGLLCKARLDAIGPVFVADLKTTANVAPGAFLRDSAKFLYHGQLAWYTDGARAAGLIPPDEPPRLVTVGKEPPYDVVSYTLGIDALVVGRALYRALLVKLQRCIDADWWPGVAPDMQELSLPQWGDGVTHDLEQETADE